MGLFNAKKPIVEQITPATESGDKYELAVTNPGKDGILPDVKMYGRVADVPFGKVAVYGVDRKLVLKAAMGMEIDAPEMFVAPPRFRIREVYPKTKSDPLTIVIVQSGV